MECRNFVKKHCSVLSEMAVMMEQFIGTSNEWNVQFSFPEILGQEYHLIEFVHLLPVHLIGRQKNIKGKETAITSQDLRPINLPSLNGKMIALTGQNAGGKTVTLLGLTDNVYLAQSGLPVFAESFKLNPKETIASVFIERGEGSLLELVLTKLKTTIHEVKKTNPNTTVVIMDELLSGTQEVMGLNLGKEVLRKLNGIGCSVMFNTQITELAEFATTELDALPFKFDANHNITPGIGNGGADLLADRIGLLDELIN
jgi:hypothetical protein